MKNNHPKNLYHQYLGFILTRTINFSHYSHQNITSFIFFEDEVKLSREQFNLDGSVSSLILGKKAESFLEYYLRCSQHYSLVDKCIQLTRNKSTIGELDFLIWDKLKKEYIHLELCYKYYLFDPDFGINEIDKWIGPNRKDTLVEKINKLNEKQFPLLFKKEAIDWLRKYSLNRNFVKQQICFKANLYVPFKLYYKHHQLANSHCIKGYWITAKDFSFNIYGNNKFFIPEKREWMLPLEYCTKWLNYNEVVYEVETRVSAKKSLLCFMKNEEGKRVEFFIVWW